MITKCLNCGRIAVVCFNDTDPVHTCRAGGVEDFVWQDDSLTEGLGLTKWVEEQRLEASRQRGELRGDG